MIEGMMGSKSWILAAGIGLAFLGGCQSSSPPKPEEMARTSLQTAPADLQLICANAAAGTAQVDSSKVLPTSSRQLDAASYSVDLDAGGRKFNCIVDSNGSVKSVQPAA